MGYNTTVLVLNDALSEIEKDPDFGKKLVKIIREQISLREIVGDRRITSYVSAGNYANAASVIETHHADETALVAIGGNYGTRIYVTPGSIHHTKESQWDLLEKALEATTRSAKVSGASSS